MRCEARGLRGVELAGAKAEVKKPKLPKAVAGAAVVRGGTWRGPPEMTTLRRGIVAPRYNTYVLVSLIGLLLQTQSATGGICWSSISNGRCKELLSQGVTKEDCCASNAAAATAYSEEDLDSGSLFFWKVLGGGVQCRPCRESCTEVRCEEGKKCVVRRGRPRCVCSPECKAPRGGGPVCGTDGKSYKNLCRLKKRACKKGSHELAVAYNGHCQSSCARVRCGQGRSCVLDQNLSPHCVRCARRCPQPPPQQRAAARPVCGADGNTYKSACHLRLAACRAGRAIPVAYKGHCKQNADCTTIRCREGQTCLSEMKSGRPRCVTCTYRCPRKRERVRNRTHRDRDPSATMLCATNNITYPSWCHIVKDACATGFVLETRHAGPCNAYDTSPLYIEEDNTSSNYGVDLADEDARFEDAESLSYNGQTHRSLALSYTFCEKAIINFIRIHVIRNFIKMYLKFVITFCIFHLTYAWEIPDNFAKTGHSNNWAVLVDTSRFWFNYRHVANVLSIYRSVKRLGIPDSQIILMIADDMACNPRNPSPATVFNNIKQHINVYGDDVEVDYRGYEVTVENFVRLLTGRLAPETPRSKKLLTDEGSNILIYLTGHGGNGFLKFQDSEEITSKELGDALEQMWQKRRYHEILFIVDTCQASSMYEKFYSPNILAVASSLVGEDSLSHHLDPAIGVYIIDRYTYYALDFLEKVEPFSSKTLGEFLRVCPKHYCLSTVGVRKDLFRRDPDKVPVTDFFGSLRPIELTTNIMNVLPVKTNKTKAIEPERKYSYVAQFPDVSKFT
ncbi:uncharacterized protein LOC117212668 [Bombus bifarius]|uniref:Uncharacterized protein LOC117212668 n=1 Tax=Bombus bifarius TaxID=103933 RepID=A0A6P8MYP2_9HYME|nr:uncharacterized protein LOC117212668 [Bombus bifarius]